MKTIIHIGQHKTGTTSIQKFLLDHKNELRKRGLYIPTGLAGFDSPSHFVLNVCSLALSRSSTMKNRLLKENSANPIYLSELEERLKESIDKHYRQARENGCNEVIWSNEGLYLLDSVAEYKKLANMFSNYSEEVKVVCCFRDVDSYRKSYLNQLKKQSIKLSKEKGSYRYLEKDSWLFDYDRKKYLLESVFDKCIFYDYCSTDNVSKFMEFINYPLADRSTGYRLNKTRL